MPVQPLDPATGGYQKQWQCISPMKNSTMASMLRRNPVTVSPMVSKPVKPKVVGTKMSLSSNDRTLPFHGGNLGLTPGGDTNNNGLVNE